MMKVCEENYSEGGVSVVSGVGGAGSARARRQDDCQAASHPQIALLCGDGCSSLASLGREVYCVIRRCQAGLHKAGDNGRRAEQDFWYGGTACRTNGGQRSRPKLRSNRVRGWSRG